MKDDFIKSDKKADVSMEALVLAMAQRAPEIKARQATREIIERPDGYLTGCSADVQVIGLVFAENLDRHEMYTKIAEKLNVPVGIVARRRATRIQQHPVPTAAPPFLTAFLSMN